MNANNPVSPKVVAAAVGAIAGPIVLAIIAALIDWVATPDGQSWLLSLPSWLQFAAPVLVAAISAAIAGYRTTDPLRRTVNGI